MTKYITSFNIKKRTLYLIAPATTRNMLYLHTINTKVLSMDEIVLFQARGVQIIHLNSNLKAKIGFHKTDDSTLPSRI